MLAGVGRRVARLACALAHRRHYLSVQIGGGDGIKPVCFKLLLPWEASRPKPYDTSPILRVMAPMGDCRDNSQATIKMHENNEVIASLELSPVVIDMCDEDEEEEQLQDIENTSEDEEDDYLYPKNEGTSSDDEIMELFYLELEDPAESTLGTVESMDSVKYSHSRRSVCSTLDAAESMDSVKYSHSRRPYSSIISLCLWPKELFASATVFEIDGKGDCAWQSFWRFSLEIDSIANENSLDATGPLVALSRFQDQRLQYTGVICDPMLQKFKISLDTHYQVKDLLGSGAEGEVYRCVSLKNTHSCAVKFSTYNHIRNEGPREVQIMKSICHPNVRTIFQAWKEKSGKPIHINETAVFFAQELCKCTLQDYLDGNTMKPVMDRINIFIEAVCGVNYLHTKGVVHRDIKPDNIFLDEHGKVKIGDFGQSALISSSSCRCGGKIYGTRDYGSPELLRMKPHDEKSDVFSLGVIYAELFGPPAGTAERREWLMKLRKLIRSQKWKKAPLSTWETSDLSKDWTGDSYLMIEMLESSPELRPSCKRILVQSKGGSLSQKTFKCLEETGSFICCCSRIEAEPGAPVADLVGSKVGLHYTCPFNVEYSTVGDDPFLVCWVLNF